MKTERLHMALTSVLLALMLSAPLHARAGDAAHDLRAAISNDWVNLDTVDVATLQGLFGLANGTREEYVASELTVQDDLDYTHARERSLALLSLNSDEFGTALKLFLNDAAATKGGRAYLGDAVLSIEMNAPGILPHVAHALYLQRDEYAFTIEDGFTVGDLELACLGAANTSVARLAVLAMDDETRPAVLPAPLGGWNNDAYLVYADDGETIHIFFQHNPFAPSWNHMYWGHLVMDSTASVSHRPIALAPRPGEGYNHNFSGSISPHKITLPDHPEKLLTPGFFTAVGTGEEGYVSFLEVPPTVMAVSADPTLDTWEPKRYALHDQNVFKNKTDTIHGETIENRYDMRDPILIEREGRFFLLLAGTAVPGRVGEGVIALLKPSNPENWAEPWVYVGDMFRHPRPWTEGGPGILETPNLVRIGNKDVLFFGVQRKPGEGNLAGLEGREGVEYFVGVFDPITGKFTADTYEDANGYFEYGRSFYAINATQRPDGEGATFFGWIKGHDERKDWNDCERGWNGAITFPRKLTLVDGVPYTEPDERVLQLRNKVLTDNETHRFSGRQITGIESRTFEIETKLDLGDAESMTITVLANRDGSAGIPIRFDGTRLWVEDEYIPVFEHREKQLALRLIVDRSVVIAFANGKSLTKTVTPPKDGVIYADHVQLSNEGAESVWTGFRAYSLGNP